MRLVDAEPIVKEFWKPEYRTQTRRDFIAVIDKSPTIDAIPVVRCINCKYKGVLWRETICEHPNGMLHKVKPDDFCSYGHRKEDKYEVS